MRKATLADLAAIKKWLRAERRRTGEGFYCNWNCITRSFEYGELFVLPATRLGHSIVGFICMGDEGPDIVEVQPSKRGMGYGRQIAEWMIARAKRRGKRLIELQCAPFTSLPFWEAMGFTYFKHGICDARMILPPNAASRANERRHIDRIMAELE